MNNDTTIAQIDGRTFSIAPLAVGPLVAADLAAKGYEARYYIATGKRGATFLALRIAATGNFIRA